MAAMREWRAGRALAALAAGGAGVAVARAFARGRAERADVPGGRKRGAAALLEAGARLLQRRTPLRQFDVYLVGFHPMKDAPHVQMEAHHFCRQLNEEVMQCVLFDGNGPDARLTGIEYIVSERLYARLPEEEQRYWHPHNYEILSGQLVAPGLPGPVEREFLRRKLNSYGKTWHVWHTGGAGRAADALPLGPAMLAWSFNRDGEAAPELLRDRDRRLSTDTGRSRAERQALCALARPQRGVDAIAGAFAGASGRPAGVEEAAR